MNRKLSSLSKQVSETAKEFEGSEDIGIIFLLVQKSKKDEGAQHKATVIGNKNTVYNSIKMLCKHDKHIANVIAEAATDAMAENMGLPSSNKLMDMLRKELK